MGTALQQILNGVALGAIYALIAIGYTMVYGVLNLINFAHSDVYMVGAFVGFFAAALLGAALPPGVVSFALVLVVAMLACGALGLTIERFAYRPVRRAPRLTPLITAIGVSLLLQNVAQVIFGPNPRTFPALLPPVTYRLGPLVASNHTILIVVVGVALMAALHLFVTRTWTGKAMRAIAFNLDAAKLMGVPTDRVIAMTFLVGSMLAAAAGVLVGLREGQIRPLMGNIYGLKAFVAAVLGGIGNVPGAMLGGMLIGVIEVVVSGLPRIGAFDPSQYRDAVTFLVLIGVLIVKPTGLLGVVRPEKV